MIILGITLAVTEEQYNRCLEYLKKHKVEIFSNTILFYIEIKNEIKAVAGWHSDLGGTIEPMVSEHPAYSKTLGVFMTGFLTGKGYTHITCWTKDENWRDILIKTGFTGEQTNKLVKGII